MQHTIVLDTIVQDTTVQDKKNQEKKTATVLPVQDKTVKDPAVQEKNSKGLTGAGHKSEGQNILDVSCLLDIIFPPLAQKQLQKEIEKEENDDLANATRNICPRIRDYGRVSIHGKTSRGSSIQ